MKTDKPKPRHERYGSADVAGILGLEDAFDSPYSVWLKKTRQIESTVTPAMRWGSRLEPFILEDYEEHEAGGKIIATQDHHVLKSWRLASATLDAVAVHGSEIIGVEAKTTREWSWKEIPSPVQAQCQWQMGVAGLSRLHVAVFYKPTMSLDVLSLDFDQALFDQVLGLVREFHERHVIGRVPPPTDGHSATTESLKTWEPTDQVAAIDHLADMIHERGGVIASIKSLEQRKDAIDNAIKASLAECSVGTIGGEIAVKWTARTTSRFDQKSFKQDHADLAAKYLVKSGYRALTIRKKFTGIEGGDDE